MSDSSSIRVVLEQDGGYAFRIAFDGTALDPLLTDESPPLGEGRGPSPAALLLASVVNCLGASLLFALRKFKNHPGPIRAEITAQKQRNAEGRWRIPRAQVVIHLSDKAAAFESLQRVLDQFEQFCLVTQSVREGIIVDVTVQDADGVVLGVEP